MLMLPVQVVLKKTACSYYQLRKEFSYFRFLTEKQQYQYVPHNGPRSKEVEISA